MLRPCCLLPLLTLSGTRPRRFSSQYNELSFEFYTVYITTKPGRWACKEYDPRVCSGEPRSGAGQPPQPIGLKVVLSRFLQTPRNTAMAGHTIKLCDPLMKCSHPQQSDKERTEYSNWTPQSSEMFLI